MDSFASLHLAMGSVRSGALSPWSPGNLASDLDPETEAIQTADAEDDFGTTDHEAHPATGALLVGEPLSLWDQVIGLARTAAVITTQIIKVVPDLSRNECRDEASGLASTQLSATLPARLENALPRSNT